MSPASGRAPVGGGRLAAGGVSTGVRRLERLRQRLRQRVSGPADRPAEKTLRLDLVLSEQLDRVPKSVRVAEPGVDQAVDRGIRIRLPSLQGVYPAPRIARQALPYVRLDVSSPASGHAGSVAPLGGPVKGLLGSYNPVTHMLTAVRCPAVESVVNWGQIIGAVLALVAVGLAAWQLSRAEEFQRQARRDLREDNRTDFHLGLVAEIADLVAVLDEYNVRQVAARLRMLPDDLFPRLRAYAGLPSTPDAVNDVAAVRQQAASTVQPGVPPTAYDRYWEAIRAPFREEVDQAISRVLGHD
jgi:hypothetical protein